MPEVKPSRLFSLVELVVAFLLVQYFADAVLWVFQHLGMPLPSMPLLKHTYLLFLLTLLMCCWVKLRGEKLSDIGLVFPDRPFLYIGRGLIAVVAIVIFQVAASAFIDPLIAALTHTSAHMGEKYFESVKGNFGLFVYLAVVGWVFGGLGEELLNRGFIMTRIARVLGEGRGAWAAAVVLQGVFFGLGHSYQGPVGMFGVAVIGIIYAIASKAWGRLNLWPAIVAHGTFDMLGFYAIYTGFAHA